MSISEQRHPYQYTAYHMASSSRLLYLGNRRVSTRQSDSLSICDLVLMMPTRDITTPKRWSPGKGRETDATFYLHGLSAYPTL